MNITAVARKARVSTATVSRTINGSPNVSPKTADRVRKAIAALGFYPDVNARALGSGRSSLYGLIISDITNPFFPELVKAFEDVAVKHGKEILTANTNYDPARMDICVTRMIQRKVDAVAIMTSEMDERLIDAFTRRNIPLFFLDTEERGPRVASVRVDYKTGILLALDHLAELGHCDPVYLSGPLGLASSRLRHDTFLAAQQQAGKPVDPRRIAQGNHRADGGYRAMEEIFHSRVAFTPVVCSNDLTAIGAMQSIYEHDLRIPEDISIVGFDDILLSAYTHPGLTTIAVPREQIASAAFLSLLHLSESKQPETIGQAHVLIPTLVPRRSTAPLQS